MLLVPLVIVEVEVVVVVVCTWTAAANAADAINTTVTATAIVRFFVDFRLHPLFCAGSHVSGLGKRLGIASLSSMMGRSHSPANKSII